MEDTEFTKFLVASYAKIGNASSASTALTGLAALHFPPKKSNIPKDVVTPPPADPQVDEIPKEVPKENPVESERTEGKTGGGDVVYQKHTVQPNDSLRRLSLLYDVTPSAIMCANDIFHERDIHTRETLLIPRCDDRFPFLSLFHF